MSTDLAAPDQAPTTPLTLLQSAIDKGLDPDQLGKLLDLQQRWERSRAAEAFAAAMNACQAEMPNVIRDKENSHTRSKYAKFESLNALIRPIYAKHGLSLSWGTEDSPLPEHVRLIADVRHVSGHCERYRGDIPLDGAGVKGNANKTAVQATGSTYSYGRRYLTKLIFNLAETDEDNDGNGRAINGDQIGLINDLLEECRQLGKPVDFPRFLKWLRVENLAELPESKFVAAVHELNRKRKGAAK